MIKHYFQQTYIIPVDGIAWLSDDGTTPQVNLHVDYMTSTLRNLHLAAVNALETEFGLHVIGCELRFKGTITPSSETLTTILLYTVEEAEQ